MKLIEVDPNLAITLARTYPREACTKLLYEFKEKDVSVTEVDFQDMYKDARTAGAAFSWVIKKNWEVFKGMSVTIRGKENRVFLVKEKP